VKNVSEGQGERSEGGKRLLCCLKEGRKTD